MKSILAALTVAALVALTRCNDVALKFDTIPQGAPSTPPALASSTATPRRRDRPGCGRRRGGPHRQGNGAPDQGPDAASDLKLTIEKK